MKYFNTLLLLIREIKIGTSIYLEYLNRPLPWLPFSHRMKTNFCQGLRLAWTPRSPTFRSTSSYMTPSLIQITPVVTPQTWGMLPCWCSLCQEQSPRWLPFLVQTVSSQWSPSLKCSAQPCQHSWLEISLTLAFFFFFFLVPTSF